MFFIRFMRFIRGFVAFSATGGFSERFINMATRRGAPLWDLHKKEELLTGKVKAKSYKLLRQPARQNGVRLRIVHKRGLPFITHRYRRRWGLVIGVLCFGAALLIASGFVWRIEIVGNERIETAVLQEALQELGLKAGMRKSAVDHDISEQRLILMLEELSWAGMYTKGTTLYVEVRERIMPPALFDSSFTCNIVATKDGLIHELTVRDGVAMVKKGDTVMKGEILVSGIVESEEGRVYFWKHASAEVVALTEYEESFSVPLTKSIVSYTGQDKTRYSLRLLDWNLPLYIATRMKGEFERKEEVSDLSLFSLALPLKLVKTSYRGYETTRIELTEEAALIQCHLLLKGWEEETFTQAVREIVTRDTTIERTGDAVILHARYTCLEEIGEEKEILLN